MRTLALLLVLATAACGEAPFKAPRPAEPTLDGAPTTLAAFPSGNWADDYGNVIDVAVTGDTLTGKGVCGPSLGMTLSGRITASGLDYQFTDGKGAAYGVGHAELVNTRHAYFETTFKDGGVPAEGLIHFLHDAPARIATGAPPPACADLPTPSRLPAPSAPQ